MPAQRSFTDAARSACMGVGRVFVAYGVLSFVIAMVYTQSSQSCSDTFVSQESSPDHRHVAVMFGQKCGGYDGMITFVKVFRVHGGELIPQGTVLSVDINPNGNALPSPSGPGGGPIVRMRWNSSKDLELAYDVKARPLRQSWSVDGVDIQQARLPQ